jgi:hypothetical protein
MDQKSLILEIIIKMFIIYIILKLLTLSDILVFSAKVGHETLQPLVLCESARFVA